MPLSIHHERYVELRHHLRKLRKDANLSQVQLAKRLETEQSYVSKIERGERYVDLLFYVDWCLACEVNPYEAMKKLVEKTV